MTAQITVDSYESKIKHVRRQALRDANWAREAHSAMVYGARATLCPIGRRVEIFVVPRPVDCRCIRGTKRALFEMETFCPISILFLLTRYQREIYYIIFKKKKKLILNVFCKYFLIIFYIVIFKKLKLSWKIKLKD